METSTGSACSTKCRNSLKPQVILHSWRSNLKWNKVKRDFRDDLRVLNWHQLTFGTVRKKQIHKYNDRIKHYRCHPSIKMNFEQLQRSLKRNREHIASDRPTKKRKNRNYPKLLELPPEIITRIVSKIAPDSLPSALQVCKLFLQIGNQDKIRYRYLSTLFRWADKEGFKTVIEQKGTVGCRSTDRLIFRRAICKKLENIRKTWTTIRTGSSP